MTNPVQKTVIIICGPTAVGKTTVAISIARQFRTEIISSHSIKENIHAAFFEKYALQKVNELFKSHDILIMVGGTGLYIKAFCEGLDEIPSIDESVRRKIVGHYEIHGLSWLQEEVRKKDPEFYRVGEIQNPQRMMRALEVIDSTGQSILSFRRNKKVKRDFRIIKIGLDLPKEELHANINSRVDRMISDGLIEEVRSLEGYRDVNALQTVGYSELFEHLDGKTSLSSAIEEIKKNTRQYARRQITWFKKDKEISWVNAKQRDEIARMAQKLVQE